MHHQVGVGHGGVDGGDAGYGQGVAGGRAAELVGAVAGADGDGQGVDAGAGDEVFGLFGVGQQLVVAQRAFGAHAVFFAGLAAFQ